MTKADRLVDAVLEVFDPQVSGEKGRLAEARLEELSGELLGTPRVGLGGGHLRKRSGSLY